MMIRPAAVLIAFIVLAACMAQRAPVAEVLRPAPAGITPLTVEQETQIGGT